jgi:heat shock protein HslJ
MKPFLFIGLLLFMTACGQMNHNKNLNQQITDSQEHIYWVNSWQRTCQGVGERLCLQVQKVNQDNQEQPDIKNWPLFYAPIKGFDYQIGHVYQIKVQETRLPSAQVPADASSIRYELIEILRKTHDDTIRLHDIWALTEIQGKPIDRSLLSQNRQEVPSLEFNLSTMQVYGTDSCNRLSGGIEKLGQGKIEFGALAGTLMACQNMELADAFQKRLAQVKHYELSDLNLRLLDNDKKPLLQFKKVD